MGGWREVGEEGLQETPLPPTHRETKVLQCFHIDPLSLQFGDKIKK